MNALIMPPKKLDISSIGFFESWLAFVAESCVFCVRSVGSSMRSTIVSQSNRS